MLCVLTLFALLSTFVSANPLDGHLRAVNNSSTTYNIQAVLVAGSRGIGNYRHQADICHAYHVLRNHGVPAENIIVFMYDDIVNNRENPERGKIINKPNGRDVYAGVAKDFIGKDVNPKNFIKVLKGDKDLAAKGKKVLTSGPNDHVFIYFADHGATGILGFPSGVLTSKDLNEALIFMNKNKLYGKLTFYVEACEAGSMFENILPKNINAFVTTASNPDESSWGAYCDVPGKFDGICLGDVYSVAWMEDSDREDLTRETLQQQFEIVVNATRQSHPQEYGQKSLGNLDVGEFQGEQVSQVNLYTASPLEITGQVDSRDVPIHMLKRQLISNSNNLTHTAHLKGRLSTLMAGRSFLQRAINKVITKLCSSGFCVNLQQVVGSRRPLVDHNSYDKVVKTFHSSCLNLGVNTDALKYMYTFANMVEENNLNGKRLGKFLKTLERLCRKYLSNNEFDEII